MKSEFIKIALAVLGTIGGGFMIMAKDRATLQHHDEVIKEIRVEQKEMRGLVSAMAPQVNFLYNRESRRGR